MKKIASIVLTGIMLFGTSVQTFAMSPERLFEPIGNSNDYSIGVQSIPIQDVLGNRELVYNMGSYNHTFTKDELLRNDVVKQSVMLGLGFVNGNAYGTFGLGIAESLLRYKTVDVVALGGVYTRKYYCRQIIDPSTKYANVPVPYQYSCVTIFYRNSSMQNQDVVYVYEINDGGPRLASN